MTNTETAMYRTMHGQPEQLRRLLQQGWDPAGEAAGHLRGVDRLFLVGIGTSYHAALAGEWMLRSIGVDAGRCTPLTSRITRTPIRCARRTGS